MAIITTYTSFDAAAPVLSGVAGDLVNILDKVLVGTAGIAYGSKPSSGWTTQYTGTNQRTYKQGAGSSGFFLHVNDAAPGAGVGREARIWGSEEASAVLTGTYLFPTATQMTNGLFVRKSATIDVIPRPWVIIADTRTVYMFIMTGDVASTYSCWMFGEFYSFKSPDLYRCMIIGRITENSAVMTSGTELADIHAGVGTVLGGHYITRGVQTEVGAITAGKVGNQNVGNGSVALFGNLSFGNTADNRIYLAPLYVTSTTGGNTVRGRMRGFWHFCHPIVNVANGQTFTGGVGDLSGKTFLVIKTSGNSGVYLMEISNTWETN